MREYFQIGEHVLQVFGSARRWVVALDGVVVPGFHDSQADAWTAGVAAVDRMERSVLRFRPGRPARATVGTT